MRTLHALRPLGMAALAAAALCAAPLRAQVTPPTFTIYPAPAALGADAGEPSLGIDWNSGAVMYQAGLQTLRVNFNDSVTPPVVNWVDVSYPLTSLLSLDAILYTDR